MRGLGAQTGGMVPPRSGRLTLWVSMLLALAVCGSLPRVAHATDFTIEATTVGEGSAWRGDGLVQGGVRGGFQFAHIVSIEAQARIGYGVVDERILELIGIGTKLEIPIKPISPHLRLGVLHQHEEPSAAASEDPFGAAVGVGDGIRHRFGAEGAVGIDWMFAKVKRVTFQASVEAYGDLFPDKKGPLFYAGGGLAFGLRYQL